MKTYLNLVKQSYDKLSKALNADGYVPLGRYEHTRKGQAVPVVFLWYHYKNASPNVAVFAHVDNHGNPTTVASIMVEQESTPRVSPSRRKTTIRPPKPRNDLVMLQ